MSVVSMKQLLEAGVHFGHQTRRWNPKMKRFIFDERNGIYIIDLQKTMHQLNEVYDEVKRRAQEGQRILFIGTKKQAKESIQEEALRCGMPSVSHRWLGGMLTNFSTIQKRVSYLKDLKKQEAEGEFEMRTKKEALNLRRKMEKLDRVLGGILEMNELPDAVYIVDPKKEYIAVEEARKLGIPIIGIVDTNCDPDVIDYPIPANDDAIKAVRLISSLMANAVLEGRSMAKDVEDAMMAQAALAEQEAAAPAEEASAEAAAPAEEASAEAAAPAEEASAEEATGVEADAAVVGQV
ncbi:30S ribosomal protein S2 [bacterium (Candidatus Blackallbacteria) CG17_big_fil_post_rev_8_21_14_2_50_48_46]|uniref:Small ribosomal subunit protein uS2 n=1 Tax=bacterium (Candidatus Blackallbacteria) CG17_big_fil_post_rev_8_21_14_2_50_48_46 TaxID=2014261 RepID=A0A2M7FY91_9BACT|nr:MAG: 30S ribosomal protein S2 [bacterium (Candidatus Blackallbacteria) CG18_big_fil_WC_8_21_14_2_50_49_26]PIW14105.1 MAG: 30S ribosomal protein S2 [bacterium (Candidatus Blackallbacteria) CG17_big_fil_post_rev_8_21_14_2_50_48_46]PIW45835.1 MAG: 30S ribosomal protein S2 [bacterium (Candidatus Blackallbacteria) CG13_big_fil_rev_8_21_14_2_50_49_14]